MKVAVVWFGYDYAQSVLKKFCLGCNCDLDFLSSSSHNAT